MKIWKYLAVSKIIAARNGVSDGTSNAVSNGTDTCLLGEVPVYPGLGPTAFSCRDTSKSSSTCKTTCNSGDIAHNCRCKDGQSNDFPCKWTNVAKKCFAKYQIKEFVIEWATDTPESKDNFEKTTSKTLKTIFKDWIAQEEYNDKGW